MKGKSKTLAALFALLLASHLLFTPIGSLRVALLLHGYPASAVFLSVQEASSSDVGLSELDNPANTTLYRIIQPIPHESATGSDLINWIVTRHGIFYTADYYGWC